MTLEIASWEGLLVVTLAFFELARDFLGTGVALVMAIEGSGGAVTLLYASRL